MNFKHGQHIVIQPKTWDAPSKEGIVESSGNIITAPEWDAHELAVNAPTHAFSFMSGDHQVSLAGLDVACRLYLHIPAKQKVTLHLYVNFSGSSALDCYVVCDADSEVNIITHYKGEVSFISKQADCKGSLFWKESCSNHAYLLSSTTTRLLAEGSSVTSQSLFKAKGEERYDVHSGAQHLAPNTSSNLITKGIVEDSAKALSRGNIVIGKSAKGSKGYEKLDTLILSPNAEADAIPTLDIHNHDVKCSHGATIGCLDESALFYLMSRGISRSAAQALLLEAFLEGFDAS